MWRAPLDDSPSSLEHASLMKKDTTIATAAGAIPGGTIGAVVGTSMGIAGGFGAIVATLPFLLGGAAIGGLAGCAIALKRRADRGSSGT